MDILKQRISLTDAARIIGVTSERVLLELSPDNLPLTLESIGGGGTDFRPPFDYIEDHDHWPVCIEFLGGVK